MARERREFQIRIVADDGEEECLCYTTKREARRAYRETRLRYRREQPDAYFEFELIEVLEQDALKGERPNMNLLTVPEETTP